MLTVQKKEIRNELDVDDKISFNELFSAELPLLLLLFSSF